MVNGQYMLMLMHYAHAHAHAQFLSTEAAIQDLSTCDPSSQRRSSGKEHVMLCVAAGTNQSTCFARKPYLTHWCMFAMITYLKVSPMGIMSSITVGIPKVLAVCSKELTESRSCEVHA